LRCFLEAVKYVGGDDGRTCSRRARERLAIILFGKSTLDFYRSASDEIISNPAAGGKSRGGSVVRGKQPGVAVRFQAEVCGEQTVG
jgi:hypothetical protein